MRRGNTKDRSSGACVRSLNSSSSNTPFHHGTQKQEELMHCMGLQAAGGDCILTSIVCPKTVEVESCNDETAVGCKDWWTAALSADVPSHSVRPFHYQLPLTTSHMPRGTPQEVSLLKLLPPFGAPLRHSVTEACCVHAMPCH